MIACGSWNQVLKGLVHSCQSKPTQKCHSMEETPVVFDLFPNKIHDFPWSSQPSGLVEVTRNQLATSIEDLYDTQCKLTELDMCGGLLGRWACTVGHAKIEYRQYWGFIKVENHVVFIKVEGLLRLYWYLYNLVKNQHTSSYNQIYIYIYIYIYIWTSCLD